MNNLFIIMVVRINELLLVTRKDHTINCGQQIAASHTFWKLASRRQENTVWQNQSMHMYMCIIITIEGFIPDQLITYIFHLV